MKRLSAIFVTLLLMCFSVCFVASASYSIVEAEFDVPEDFTVLYGEDDMSESEVFRFISQNEGVKLSCYRKDNPEEISFSFMNELDAIDYFFDNLSSIDGQDFTFESVETCYADGLNQGFMFDGTVDSVPVETYVFSTTGNIYGFEFTIYDESERYLVSEVINTLYITDFESYIGDEYEDDDFEDILGVFMFFFASVAAVLSIIIKSKSKAKPGTSAVGAPALNSQETATSEVQKPSFKKFELNGKNINIFNERLTVGKADDNFAQKELEKERKEREKMFH